MQYVSIWTTIGFAAAFTANTALAEPSADLVFCSKRESSRERIACYDATARVAASKTKPSQATAVAPQRASAAAHKGTESA
jgi:hypothetical protein